MQTKAHISQPRVPSGVTIAGQWTTSARSEPLLSLANPSTLDARLTALEADGYVPAVVVASMQTPLRAGSATSWWDEHHVSAEYQPTLGGYPQMPDDDLTDARSGRGMRGGHRVRRMLYSGKEVSLRMPAVAAVRRYSKTTSTRTFDVPVSVALNDTGEEVSAWVRVSRGSNGLWSATTVGMEGDQANLIAESVCATLEARRPSVALKTIESLAERRAARQVQAGAELTPVRSGWIDEVGYDPGTGIMATRTDQGNLYGHQVSKSRYDAVAKAYSPGVMFNRVIKGTKRMPVGQCTDCGRFYSDTKGHTCPVTPATPVNIELDENSTARERVREIAEREQSRMRRAGRQATRDPKPAKAPAPLASQPDPAPRGIASSVHPVPEKVTSIDMQDWFEFELEQRENNVGHYGSPGFTAPLVEPLAKCTTAEYVPEKYNMQQGVGTILMLTNGRDGMVTYAGLGGQDALNVGWSLTPRQRNIRQGDGPTVGSALLAASKSPDEVAVCGYMISPRREDERFVAGGVHLFDETAATPQAALATLREKHGLDFQGSPSRVERVMVPWGSIKRAAWRIMWAGVREAWRQARRSATK